MTGDPRERNAVRNYAGKRAFYTKDMARKHRAAQDTSLPPRCSHCRLPGNVKLNGVPHCDQHALGCDASCGWNDPPVMVSPPSPWTGDGTTQPIAQVKDGPMAYRGRVWRLTAKLDADLGGTITDLEEQLCPHAHRKAEPARRCGERWAESLNGSG
jgi:hypothetical protein